MIQVERRAGLSLVAGVLCVAVLSTALPVCSAQTATPVARKKVAAKPEPTAQDLYAYIRGALLAFSPDDRINDTLEVALDPTATVLTIKQPDGHCDIFLNALDANTLVWDVYDASDSMASRQPLARLTVISVPGKSARTCYDVDNQVDSTIVGNRARLLFSWGKIPDGSGFQARMTKAMKKLIALSGGSAEKDIFKP
jgi:hypothetical protein